MTTQENTILLTGITQKLDKIIELLQGKRSQEPNIQFTKACPSADMSEIKQYEQEVYKRLDNVEK